MRKRWKLSFGTHITCSLSWLGARGAKKKPLDAATIYEAHSYTYFCTSTRDDDQQVVSCSSDIISNAYVRIMVAN